MQAAEGLGPSKPRRWVAGEQGNRTLPGTVARTRNGFEDRGGHQSAILSRERCPRGYGRHHPLQPQGGARGGDGAGDGETRGGPVPSRHWTAVGLPSDGSPLTLESRCGHALNAQQPPADRGRGPLHPGGLRGPGTVLLGARPRRRLPDGLRRGRPHPIEERLHPSRALRSSRPFPRGAGRRRTLTPRRRPHRRFAICAPPSPSESTR